MSGNQTIFVQEPSDLKPIELLGQYYLAPSKVSPLSWKAAAKNTIVILATVVTRTGIDTLFWYKKVKTQSTLCQKYKKEALTEIV